MDDAIGNISNMLRSLEKLKSKLVWVIALFLIIAYIATVNITGNPGYSLKITIILGIVVVAVISILAHFSRQESEMTIIESYHEQEKGKIELEKVREVNKGQLLNKILETYDSNLARFFKVLERHGVLKLGEVETKILSAKKRGYFIIEWGEGSPEEVREAFLEKKTFFTKYLEQLKQSGYEIIRVMPPLNAHLYVTTLPKEEVIKQLKGGYWKFVDQYISDNIKDTELYKKVDEWRNWAKTHGRPVILITAPYRVSLLEILDTIPKNQKPPEVEKIKEGLLKVIQEDIKLVDIRLSYLLEAVGFSEDIVSEFARYEDSLISALRDVYKIPNDSHLFSELMSKKDFWDVFVEIFQSTAPHLYTQLERDSRFDELEKLTKRIQMTIFGVYPNDRSNNGDEE